MSRKIQIRYHGKTLVIDKGDLPRFLAGGVVSRKIAEEARRQARRRRRREEPPPPAPVPYDPPADPWIPPPESLPMPPDLPWWMQPPPPVVQGVPSAPATQYEAWADPLVPPAIETDPFLPSDDWQYPDVQTEDYDEGDVLPVEEVEEGEILEADEGEGLSGVREWAGEEADKLRAKLQSLAGDFLKNRQLIVDARGRIGEQLVKARAKGNKSKVARLSQLERQGAQLASAQADLEGKILTAAQQSQSGTWNVSAVAAAAGLAAQAVAHVAAVKAFVSSVDAVVPVGGQAGAGAAAAGPLPGGLGIGTAVALAALAGAALYVVPRFLRGGR